MDDDFEEAKIIRQVQAGRTEDFTYLVHRYKNGLFRMVGNLVDSGQVEDIVQETFVAAFKNICRFDPDRGSFCTWIYRIARNFGLNAWKKKRDEPLPEGLVIADERTPADYAQKNEIFQRLDQALEELRFQDRVIFVLADLEYNLWYLYLLLIVVGAGYPANFAHSIRAHVLQAFKVPSASMVPGILPGDRVLLNKTAYKTQAPRHGDVVIFTYPDDRRLNYVKRIVALPGDTVEIRDNILLVNDRPLDRHAEPGPVLYFKPGQTRTILTEEKRSRRLPGHSGFGENRRHGQNDRAPRALLPPG